jgi:ABC-type nitrate/sulfonate/bicarbonate transport system ATPase subunit
MSRAGVRDRLEIAIERKSFRNAVGNDVEILKDLAFSLDVGEVGAIVGPSGCGKTTLLRIIAGLDQDFRGSVALPAHGRLGMVFQEPRLLPWRSLRDNIRIAAPQAGDDEINALLVMLGLQEHADHFPGELSGGLARRAALARAFAVQPDLLVLDEPFVSLDAALAARLRDELAEMVTLRPVTTLMVTHDLDEAIRLADRIILFSSPPAHVIGEVTVEAPRLHRSAADIASIRARIGDTVTQALG